EIIKLVEKIFMTEVKVRKQVVLPLNIERRYFDVYGAPIIGLNHSYRGKMTAKITSGSSKVKKIQTTVTNVAYGLLGNGGTYVGIVYNGSKSSSTTKNKTSWSMDETVKYGGVAVVYTYTNAYTRITTTTGSFNLYAF
ncbi:hypothetical protein ABWK49_22735, partial [Priestia megaterium]